MKIALMLQQSSEGHVLQENRTMGIRGNDRIAMIVVRRMGHHAGNICENCMVELDNICAWMEVRDRVVSKVRLEDKRICAPTASQGVDTQARRDDVVAFVADDDVIKIIAGAVDIAGARS